MARRFCSLLSGGKDSNYALYRALKRGWEPACIVGVRPLRDDSWMFHTALTEAPSLQAQAMGLGDVYVTLHVSGLKEREVGELEEGLRRLKDERGFDVIVVGALASRYQRDRIEAIAERLGVEVYSPSWGEDPEMYMKGLLGEGFKFIISRTSTMGLDWRHLGRIIDQEALEDILARSRRHGFHPAFEGGEAETLVVDAPHFKKRLCVEGEVVRRGPYIFELAASRLWLSHKNGGWQGCLKIRPYALEGRLTKRS